MELDKKTVILIFADISGYTRYMLSNRTALVHGQVVITELMKAIIDQIEIPLEISKLEGDAIFAFAAKGESEAVWEQVKRKTGEKLIKFFEAFAQKLAELSASNMCNCNTCKNIEKLKLKVIVHFGEALFYRIGKFNELSGVDVITLHRLSKNSLKSDQYVLLTKEAYSELEFPEKASCVPGEERYDDVGVIKTYNYLFAGNNSETGAAAERSEYSSLFYRLISEFRKMWRTTLIRMKLKRLPEFRNLPEVKS